MVDLVLEAYADMHLTENHIRQIHQTLLRHSDEDARHRASYKTLTNNVVALDADGREIGVVLETTSPFDTPREMEALVAWTRKTLVGADHLPVDVGKIVADGRLGDAPLDQIGDAPSSTTRSPRHGPIMMGEHSAGLPGSNDGVPGSNEIDSQVKFCRLLDRNVARSIHRSKAPRKKPRRERRGVRAWEEWARL